MPAPHPQVPIPQTEVRTLYLSRVKQDYELRIALPPGYPDSGKPYPTLYMLDANWLFDLSVPVVRFLAFDQQMPHTVVVGVGAV